jgi:hypothetical protein
MDEFDNLPESPETEPAENTFITAADIKAVISGKLYDELTCGDDAVTVRAIGAAVIREESMLSVLRVKLNPSLALHRIIGQRLTVYELYVYNGDEAGGHEYLKAATDLISVNYGDPDAAKASLHPAGALKKPVRKRL